MIQLYLLRHGIAVARGTRGYEADSDRPLTAEGELKIQQIARTLKRLKVELDLVLTSPFARALRSAEIVSDVVKARAPLEVCHDLAVGGNPEGVFRQLHDRTKPARSVMLIGHEPYLSQLISIMLIGNPELKIKLKKGGLCRLAVTRLRFGRCATLEWLLTPRILIGK